jgi:translation initiation factor 5
MAPPGSIVNISGLTPVDDPAYRYKMPSVFGKIEGRGNGIKTVIPNITDVGLSLHRSPAEVNKFFGCELGAQSSYSPDTDRAVVNGAHTDAVLQQLMHKYIELFVLCPNCRLPETQYKIKSECIWHKCAACGAKEMVDMQHKLCTFILAQDKKSKQEAKKSEKKDKKERKENGNEAAEEKRDKKKDKDSDQKDKKKKDKDKKEKKEKKVKKHDSSNSKDLNGLLDDTEELSLDDNAGLDDAGVMGELMKYLIPNQVFRLSVPCTLKSIFFTAFAEYITFRFSCGSYDQIS